MVAFKHSEPTRQDIAIPAVYYNIKACIGPDAAGLFAGHHLGGYETLAISAEVPICKKYSPHVSLGQTLHKDPATIDKMFDNDYQLTRGGILKCLFLFPNLYLSRAKMLKI